MRTAFTSWKLAKGLYIIPLVMAYRPLLGVGEDNDILAPVVLLAFAATAAGLVASAAALDRFLLRKADWGETILFVLAALCLFWPDVELPSGVVLAGWLTNLIGGALLFAAILSQKYRKRARTAPAPSSS
jgi:TRAP-type uncharacterized transport system fused permease subunit